MSTLSVTKIHDGLWQFSEDNGAGHSVDAYLLTGDKRALLIDALDTVNGAYARAREITALPLDVLVEHGHGDHTGPAMREIKDAGGKVYLHPGDLPLLLDDKERHFTRDFFTPIQNGEKLDLGGVVLDIILVSGHTPGSLVALDRKRHWLLSSDTLGSGPYWLQLSQSLALHTVRDNLQALYDDVKQYPDLCIYPGHRYQSPNQIGLQYLADTIETIELILAGKLTGTPIEGPAKFWTNPWFTVEHKSSLGLIYNPEKL